MSTPNDADEERTEETTQARITHEETFSGAERNGTASRRKQVVIVAALAVVAIVVILFAFLWLRPAKEVKTEAPAAASNTGKVKFLMEQQWLIRMKLALVEEQTVARQITATGRVVPAANKQAVIAPPVGGILAGGQIPRIGQRVAQGQTIAVLQQTATSAEQAQVRAATASIGLENARLEADRRTAAGEVESARVRLDLAQQEANRAQRLYERKAFSERQLQTAEADLKSAKAGHDAAVKRLEALTSSRSLAAARTNVGSANASFAVRAPLSGYVTKVNKSLGEQVAPGEAILEISNLDTVWIEAPIFERDLNRLGGGAGATFTTAAYPGQEFRGSLVDIGAVIDERTRAATVVFQVANGGRALRIGMQANVRLDAGESATAMMIPRSAVLDNEGKKLVYVLLSGEEFQRREVTLGDEYGDKVAVLSGLNKGERVVTQGAYQIRLQELRPADAGAHSHET
ncbi:MAG: efflux RND transporter periplasmic adaptor subunit [Acidobacteriota bacterium]|nr:efflux RND transporter periplasmic adaptor subunit [Acidobacteriota bacterium]